MMKTKYIDFLGYIFIFVFSVLVPQFQTEGTGLNTTTVKNNGNQGIIPTADVPQRTIVVDITKPPKSDEVKWILDLDKYSRLLIINQKRNTTFSLCGNNWTNEYATVVCRHLKRSDNGIAGVIPRNKNLSRIAYGLDCPVNFTNMLKCKPDYTNAAREVCKLTGDASVRCYNDTDSHFTDNTDWCINIIVVGSLSFATILISLLIIIYIQRRKLIKASYASLTVRRDQNHYNEIHHQMSDHISEHNYEVSALSVIPTSEGQVATHQKINQIQHVDTSGYLILSGITETGGDHYQSIAN
ncbi:uncharacterized protein LOC134727122 [Mytilus trossulus]|uniref:uncharacterized protein LOC134727122 n=1 Tax=Mytilus trossulus TaxID=6551 RepID=UPI003004C357